VAIGYILWYFGIFPHFGKLYQEKSGNPVANIFEKNVKVKFVAGTSSRSQIHQTMDYVLAITFKNIVPRQIYVLYSTVGTLVYITLGILNVIFSMNNLLNNLKSALRSSRCFREDIDMLRQLCVTKKIQIFVPSVPECYCFILIHFITM
jgi:hypothetical protein